MTPASLTAFHFPSASSSIVAKARGQDENLDLSRKGITTTLF